MMSLLHLLSIRTRMSTFKTAGHVRKWSSKSLSINWKIRTAFVSKRERTRAGINKMLIYCEMITSRNNGQ